MVSLSILLSVAHVANVERLVPCIVALTALPCIADWTGSMKALSSLLLINAFTNWLGAFSLNGELKPPVGEGNTYLSFKPMARISISNWRACFDNGTKCNPLLLTFIFSGGTVHTVKLSSNSAHVIKRTVLDLTPVSIQNSTQRAVMPSFERSNLKNFGILSGGNAP